VYPQWPEEKTAGGYLILGCKTVERICHEFVVRRAAIEATGSEEEVEV
jgi:hypothetical protein